MEERWVCMLSSSPTEWAKSQKKKQSEGVRQSHNVKITLLQTAFLAIWEICSL